MGNEAKDYKTLDESLDDVMQLYEGEAKDDTPKQSRMRTILEAQIFIKTAVECLNDANKILVGLWQDELDEMYFLKNQKQ